MKIQEKIFKRKVDTKAKKIKKRRGNREAAKRGRCRRADETEDRRNKPNRATMRPNSVFVFIEFGAAYCLT